MKKKIFIGGLFILVIGILYIIYPREGTFEEFVLDKSGIDKYNSVSLISFENVENSLNIGTEDKTKELINNIKDMKIKENSFKNNYNMKHFMNITGQYKEEMATYPRNIEIVWSNEKEFVVRINNDKRRYYKIVDNNFDLSKIKELFKKY